MAKRRRKSQKSDIDGFIIFYKITIEPIVRGCKTLASDKSQLTFGRKVLFGFDLFWSGFMIYLFYKLGSFSYLLYYVSVIIALALCISFLIGNKRKHKVLNVIKTSNNLNDIISGLVNLGYTQNEAKLAAQIAIKNYPNAEMKTQFADALKALAP